MMNCLSLLYESLQVLQSAGASRCFSSANSIILETDCLAPDSRETLCCLMQPDAKHCGTFSGIEKNKQIYENTEFLKIQPLHCSCSMICAAISRLQVQAQVALSLKCDFSSCGNPCRKEMLKGKQNLCKIIK